MFNHPSPDTRILIIEDDPLIIHAILPTLKECGETLIATSGEQALQLAHEQPNLILLDLNLPDMHGMELIRLLRHQLHATDIPLVVLTATRDADTEVRCLHAGASDFLRKPISLPVLEARLKVHLELQQKTQLLINLASLDPLTGLANRRTFDSVYERYWSLHYRQRAPLSLLFSDLDHFKVINDQYGHEGGDHCLIEMSRVLTTTAKRPSDLVCRYGGEEFVVLLPNTSEHSALQLAHKAQSLLRQNPIRFHDQDINLTASWGLATTVPEASQISHDLIQRADQLLYQAKATGRDKVVSQGDAS